jgi:hypothetical protein
VWINFAGTANGRAYFGFGTTANGLDSVVLAPNSDQLLIQNNAGFNSYTNLAAANQTYAANTWYLVQIKWGTSGTVVANLYASNGTKLLNSVTAATGDTTPGTFAFRAIGSTKYFSTVTDTPDVNNFAIHSALGSTTTTTASGKSSSATQRETGGSEQSPATTWMGITLPAPTKSASEKPWIIGNPFFAASEFDPFVVEWGFVRVE